MVDADQLDGVALTEFLDEFTDEFARQSERLYGRSHLLGEFVYRGLKFSLAVQEASDGSP